MRAWCFSVLLLASVACAEDVPFQAEWHASCEIGGAAVDVHFKSRSGDPTEDDMAVTLQWAGSRDPVVLPVKSALFQPVEFTTDAVNLCKDIGAFELPSGRVLFLLLRNDRPSWPQVTALVVDPKTKTTVQNIGDLGDEGGTIYLMKAPNGFRIMLLRKWYQDANSHGEFGAPDWFLIHEVSGRIVTTWEVARK